MHKYFFQNTLTCGFKSTSQGCFFYLKRTFSYLESGWAAKLSGRPTAPRPAASCTPLFCRFSGLPFPFSLVFSAQLNINGLLLLEDAPSFTLTSYHDWLWSPFSLPSLLHQLLMDNATKPGLKKLTLRGRAPTQPPTCCALVTDAVATKRSCGLNQTQAKWGLAVPTALFVHELCHKWTTVSHFCHIKFFWIRTKRREFLNCCLYHDLFIYSPSCFPIIREIVWSKISALAVSFLKLQHLLKRGWWWSAIQMINSDRIWSLEWAMVRAAEKKLIFLLSFCLFCPKQWRLKKIGRKKMFQCCHLS